MAQTVYTPVFPTANIDPTVIQRAVVAVSSANILAMNGAPVTVLGAPGTGKCILVHGACFKVTTTATGYANGGNVSLQYNGGSVNPLAGVLLAAVITAGAGNTRTWIGPNVAANGITVPSNKAIEITNATAPFITGTGTINLELWYSIVPDV